MICNFTKYELLHRLFSRIFTTAGEQLHYTEAVIKGTLGILKCAVYMWLLPIPEHLQAEHLFLNNTSGRLFFFFQGFSFFLF